MSYLEELERAEKRAQTTFEETDDEMLGAAMQGNGSDDSGGIGRRQRRNEMTHEQMLEEDARRRREAGGSMGLVDEYELGTKGPSRMPAKNRKAQLLTDKDIRKLADNRDYPVDFMGEDYFVNPSQPTESALAYSKIESPFEREEFLRKRRDYVLQKRKEDEERDYMIQHPATAYGAGIAVGLGGGLVAATSAAAAGIAPFAGYLIEAFRFGVLG